MPDLIAGIGSTPFLPFRPGVGFRVDPDVLLALTRSLADAIQNDQRMWTWDTTYATKRVSNAVCIPRGQAARPWTPGGPCGLDRQDCAWSTYVLSVACAPRAFNEQMFQYPRYVWGQAKLRTLLASMPGAYPTRARAREWAAWMTEVLAVASAMLWATNIRDAYAGKVGFGSGTGPDVWDSTKFLSWEGAAMQRFEATVQASRARHGAHGSGPVMHFLRMRNWNDVANPSGWTRTGLSPAVVPRSRADFLPSISGWPLSWKNPIGTAPNSIGVQQPVHVSVRPPTDAEALVRLIELSPEREVLVPVSLLDIRGRPVNGTYVGAEGLFLYCRAVAEDLTNTSFAKIVSTGLTRWREAISRLPYDYRRGLYGGLEDSAAFGNMMAEAKADEVFGGVQAGLSAVGGVLANIPVAQIGAVVIAIVQALLAALNEIFKATDSYATGSAAIPPCPPLPVIRVIEGGQECRWDLDPEADTVPGGGGVLPGGIHLTLPDVLLAPKKNKSGGGLAVAGVGILAVLLALRGAGK